MELGTLLYHRRTGWSVPAFPALDSERTLVLCFAGPALCRHPEPLLALIDAYPRSCVLGCSTAGELSGQVLRDDSLCAVVLRLSRGALRQIELRPRPGAAGEAGEVIGRALQGPDLRAVLLLGDGEREDSDALGQGLGAALPGVPLLGVLAADGQSDRGWVFTRGARRRTGERDGEGALPGQRGLLGAVGLYGAGLRVGLGALGPEQGLLPPEPEDGSARPPDPAALSLVGDALPEGSLTVALGCARRRARQGACAEREIEALWRARGAAPLIGCYGQAVLGGAPPAAQEGALLLLGLGEERGDGVEDDDPDEYERTRPIQLPRGAAPSLSGAAPLEKDGPC